MRSAVAGLVSVDELARRVRHHPGRWILLGVLGGAFAGRFLGRPLAREGQRRVVAAATGRLQHLGVGLASALLAAVGRRASGDTAESQAAPPGPPVAARSDVR